LAEALRVSSELNRLLSGDMNRSKREIAQRGYEVGRRLVGSLAHRCDCGGRIDSIGGLIAFLWWQAWALRTCHSDVALFCHAGAFLQWLTGLRGKFTSNLPSAAFNALLRAAFAWKKPHRSSVLAPTAAKSSITRPKKSPDRRVPQVQREEPVAAAAKTGEGRRLFFR